MLKRSLGVAGVVGATGMAARGVAAEGERTTASKGEEVLVGVASDAPDTIRSTVRSTLPDRAEIVHVNEDARYAAVRFPSGPSAATDRLANALSDAGDIAFVESNRPVEPIGVESEPKQARTQTDVTLDTDEVSTQAVHPNDPYFPHQWNLHRIRAHEAWSHTLGSPNVLVSVVDTGTAYSHPNLHGNYVGGHDFVDGNGNPAPPDPAHETHGTVCGGVAVAQTNNGTGTSGIAQSRFFAARAQQEQNQAGPTFWSDVADAITWSRNAGSHVINLSVDLGGHSQAVQNACSYAYSNGSLLVAAAGNTNGGSVSYPAAYGECVAVASVNQHDQRADHSSAGPQVELCAPGTNIWTTTTPETGSYTNTRGTSVAAPHVSGVAALTMARWGTNHVQTRQHLQQMATDLGLHAHHQGHGLVDALNCVQHRP